MTAGSSTRLRDEFRARLRQNRFTHFVTLSTNAPGTSSVRMRDLLKTWDQSLNRFLIGPKWHRRPDIRMMWFAFLENPGTNPHWHLVAEIDQLDTDAQRERLEGFGLEAERVWCKLLPSGSVNVQLIWDEGAIDYSTKFLSFDDDRVISSLEFIRK